MGCDDDQSTYLEEEKGIATGMSEASYHLYIYWASLHLDPSGHWPEVFRRRFASRSAESVFFGRLKSFRRIPPWPPRSAVAVVGLRGKQARAARRGPRPAEQGGASDGRGLYSHGGRSFSLHCCQVPGPGEPAPQFRNSGIVSPKRRPRQKSAILLRLIM